MSTTDKRDEPVARTDEDLSKVNGGTVFPPHVSGINEGNSVSLKTLKQ